MAQANRYVVGLIESCLYRDIKLSIAVEIGSDQCTAKTVGQDQALMQHEGARAISLQQCPLALSVSEYQIQLCVAVEIPEHHPTLERRQHAGQIRTVDKR